LGTDGSVILTGNLAHVDDRKTILSVTRAYVGNVTPIVVALTVPLPWRPDVSLPRMDVGKSVPEVSGFGAVLAQSQTVPGDGCVNPKVAPGKVHWHRTPADACEAARKSGKPVLLFMMLGKLDDQFC